jgi:hypothetical protein
MATAVAPSLNDEQLGGLLELIPGADSVELKLTVPESHLYEVAASLGMDPLDAQIRQVFFFDTPDLALNRAGVVMRARRVQRKGGDSVVKLRPVVPDALPKKLRRSPDFTVEVDAMPGGYVCSGALKRPVDSAAIRQTTLERGPLKPLFSKEQRAFFEQHAPAGITLEDLSILGPILVFKLKFAPEELGRRMVAEVWMYPDNTRVLELSTKCEPRDAFLVAAEARAYLSERGVELGGQQTTKTRKALQFFARRLAAG